MLTTIMAVGKTDVYLSCGHRLKGNRKNPFNMKHKVGRLFNCYQCDKGKPLHGKPIKETATWKVKNLNP